MVIFRRHAGPAVYHAFLSSEAALSTPPVEAVTLALTRLDSWTAFVIHHPREMGCREGRRQIEYSDALGQVLCLAATQLGAAPRRLPAYWHLEKFKVGTYSISFEILQKARRWHVPQR